jgi:hypothetical protein
VKASGKQNSDFTLLEIFSDPESGGVMFLRNVG